MNVLISIISLAQIVSVACFLYNAAWAGWLEYKIAKLKVDPHNETESLHDLLLARIDERYEWSQIMVAFTAVVILLHVWRWAW